MPGMALVVRQPPAQLGCSAGQAPSATKSNKTCAAALASLRLRSEAPPPHHELATKCGMGPIHGVPLVAAWHSASREGGGDRER